MSLSRKTTSLTLMMVGKNPELARLLPEALSLAAVGEGKLQTFETVAEAVRSPHWGQNTLLALFTPAMGEVSAAREALDAYGLPRWGMIIFGEGPVPAGTVQVLPMDWQVRTIAQVFRLTLALHALARENARFRGDFLTIGTRVAHDLRSPLGGVLTTVDVLKEVLGEEAPSRLPLLEPISESTDGLTKLIRQISTVAKATAEENPRQRFNMGPVFWTAFQRVERDALKAGATITQSATWPEVEGEPAWAESMWHALLCNALQYSGLKPRIEAGWSRDTGETRFWLTDRGEVPVAKRAALFQPFHLLHHPNAPRGFGLPLVQRLAELQGGACGYELMPEGGSCFYFTLPASETG